MRQIALPLILGLSFLFSSEIFSAERTPPRRSVNELTQGVPDLIFRADAKYSPVQVSRSAAEAAGLHVLEEGRLLLVTDLELDEAVRSLPKLVTDAYEPICQFLGIMPQSDWQLTAFLIRENAPFVEAGYFPDYLPPFLNGFAFHRSCWLYEQPSEYYRRHLLLHEMVHCVVLTHQGFVGPLWYAEGCAEFLATHDVAAEPLQLGWMPPNREATPYYARIREIRDALAAGKGRTFEEAFAFQRGAYATNEVYYWSWSLFWFLANHPDTQESLRKISPLLKTSQTGEQVTEKFFQSLGNRLPKIRRDWEMYLATLDYGYSLDPMLWDEPAEESLEKGPLLRTVEATRGWQPTGIRVRKGALLTFQTQGRFEIYASGEAPYPCEANGVTLEYFRGFPIGRLLAAVLPEESSSRLDVTSSGTFFQPHSIGRHDRWKAPRDGQLFLRLNIPETRLEKCEGQILVRIR